MNEIEQLRKQLKELEEQLAQEKAMADGGKTVVNGTFGKLFSRFSIFYAPSLGIAVTISGQLSLLMLIERLELAGVRVVSANTDGIEMLMPMGYESIVAAITDWWQKLTGLTLEQKSYLALHSRDVNNYVSIEFDGSTKRKGIFGRSGVISPDSTAGKHPDLDICSDAVVDYLSKGTPLAQTIIGCRDIRKFLRVRGAKGGARLASSTVNLGRAVRWYYAAGCVDYIVDATSGNKVAGSDGARLLMELPLDMPLDVDYAYYINNAAEMLHNVGVTP